MSLSLRGEYKKLGVKCHSTYRPMFIAVLFVAVKKSKQPKYPSIDEGLNETWYI